MKVHIFLLTLLITSVASFAQTSADEKTIKTVIAEDSAAFYQRNADKTLSYWANVPYASHSYTEKGMGYVRGYDVLNKAMRNVLSRFPDADKDVYKTHDFMIHGNGNSALVSFITDVLDGTKKRQNYEARYVEKINGVWKIVSAFGKAAP